MMGIGIFEMVIIAAIALIVIGPEKFPDFAKLAVRTIRELRGQWDDMKAELNKELKPVKEEWRDLKRHDPGKYLDALSQPAVSPPTPYNREEGKQAAVQEEPPQDTGEQTPADTAENTDTPPDSENPEPAEGAWEKSAPEPYKVAGGDEFENPAFKGPERMD